MAAGRLNQGAFGAASDLALPPRLLDLRAISIAEGLRAGISVSVLAVASVVLGRPLLMEAALGAFLACICDAGGPLARRLPPLLLLAALGAAVVAGFGLLRAAPAYVILPAAALALFAGGLARGWGQRGLLIGNQIAVLVIFALDAPLPDVRVAATLAGWFAFGVLWVALLTPLFWPIQPFEPARRAVGAAWRQVGFLVRDLCALLAAPEQRETLWERHARRERRAVRAVIERARAVVRETLSVRGANSRRAGQALLRLETADQIFGALIALGDLLEQDHALAADPAPRRFLRRLAPLLGAIGAMIERGSGREVARLARAVEALAASPTSAAWAPVALNILQRLRVALTVSAPATADPGGEMGLGARLLAPLGEAMDPRSGTFRHAARLAVAGTLGIAVTLMRSDPYQHWLTISIVVTLQPNFATTWLRALERLAGTVLGAAIGALIAFLCPGPLAFAWALLPVTATALALRGVNFGLFIAALTPAIVLLVEIGAHGAGEFGVVFARVGYTLVGGALAVAAGLLLWPGREEGASRRLLTAAVAAHGRFASAALAACLGEGSVAAADDARRAAGLASNALEGGLARALLEPGRVERRAVDRALVVDAALRRFAARIAALQLDRAGLRALGPALGPWREWIGVAMAGLAAEPPQPPPPAPPALPGHVGEGFARLARQVDLVAGALGRAAEA